MKKPKVVKAIVSIEVASNEERYFVGNVETYGDGGNWKDKNGAEYGVQFGSDGTEERYEATITIGRKVKK